MKNIKQTTLISGLLSFLCFIPQIVIGYAISSAENTDTLRVPDSLDSIHILIQDARKLSNSQSTCHIATAKLDRVFEITQEQSVEMPVLYYIARAEVSLTLQDLKQTDQQIKMVDGLLSKQSDDYIQSQFNICLGKYYHFTGLLDKSIKQLSKNVELSQKQGLGNILPTTYEQLANVYSSLDSSRLIRQYLDLMLKAASDNNDYFACYRACIRIGFGLRDKDKKYEESNSYFSKALLNAQILKDTLKVIYSMGAIGRSYYLHNMLDSSLFWYNEAMKQAVSINSNSRIGNCYGNIATVYRDKNDYNLATSFIIREYIMQH